MHWRLPWPALAVALCSCTPLRARADRGEQRRSDATGTSVAKFALGVGAESFPEYAKSVAEDLSLLMQEVSRKVHEGLTQSYSLAKEEHEKYLEHHKVLNQGFEDFNRGTDTLKARTAEEHIARLSGLREYTRPAQEVEAVDESETADQRQVGGQDGYQSIVEAHSYATPQAAAQAAPRAARPLPAGGAGAGGGAEGLGGGRAVGWASGPVPGPGPPARGGSEELRVGGGAARVDEVFRPAPEESDGSLRASSDESFEAALAAAEMG